MCTCTHTNYLELAGGGDLDSLRGGAVGASDSLDGSHDVHALTDISEHGVLAIQVRSGDGAQEKLRAVGVWAGVGHGENSRSSVSQGEVLVLEFGTIDGLTTSAITSGEITTLAHELGDHTVEETALVVQRLSGLSNTLLTSAQSTEILSSSWHNTCSQSHHNSTSRTAANGDVEEDSWTVGRKLRGPVWCRHC